MLMIPDAAFPAVYSSVATQASEATHSSKPTVATGSPAGPSSTDDLQNWHGDDDGVEAFEDHSRGENHGVTLFGKICTKLAQRS